MSYWEGLKGGVRFLTPDSVEEHLDDWYTQELPEHSERLSDDMSLLADGEINAGELALRAAGETGQAFGGLIAPVVDAVIPDFVKEGVAHLAQGAMETGPAKQLMAWAEENPRAARNAMSVLNATEILPAGRLWSGAKGVGNRMAQGAPIHLPGFYDGGPLGAVVGGASVAPGTLKSTVLDNLTPQGRANARAGIGHRVKEVAADRQKYRDAEEASGLLTVHNKAVTAKEALEKAEAKKVARDAYDNMDKKEIKASGVKAPKKLTKAEKALIERGEPDGILDPETLAKTEAKLSSSIPAAVKIQNSILRRQEKFMGADSEFGRWLANKEPKVAKWHEKVQKEKDKGTFGVPPVQSEVKSGSFLAGQVEYQKLIRDQIEGGISKAPKPIQDFWQQLGVVGAGKLDDSVEFNEAFRAYQPTAVGTMFDDSAIDTVRELVTKTFGQSSTKAAAGGRVNNTHFTMKNPNMFDDLTQESRVKQAGQRVYHNAKFKKMWAKHRGEAIDPKEFAGMSVLVEGGPRKTGTKNIKDYFELTGKDKLTADETKRLANYRRRMTERVTTDSQGRAYVIPPHEHLSASKTMGGVADVMVFDQKGNIANMIIDEHDLFSVNAPGMSRMINMSSPYIYNYFRKGDIDQRPAKDWKQAKADWQRQMESEYGVDVPYTEAKYGKKGQVLKGKEAKPMTGPEAMKDTLEKAVLGYEAPVGLLDAADTMWGRGAQALGEGAAYEAAYGYRREQTDESD